MADEGDDSGDLSDVTYEFDVSGRDLWNKLELYALSSPTFATQLLGTTQAVAAIAKVNPPLTPAQLVALQTQASRLKALSSNTFGGPSLSTAS